MLIELAHALWSNGCCIGRFFPLLKQLISSMVMLLFFRILTVFLEDEQKCHGTSCSLEWILFFFSWLIYLRHGSSWNARSSKFLLLSRRQNRWSSKLPCYQVSISHFVRTMNLCLSHYFIGDIIQCGVWSFFLPFHKFRYYGIVQLKAATCECVTV